MKADSLKKSILFFIIACCYHVPFAQTATISGKVYNAPNGKIHLIRTAFPFRQNDVYEGFKTIGLNKKGAFNIAINLREPEIMRAVFNDSADHHLLDYYFYLAPGDDLKMESVKGKAALTFKVTGTGANNNQGLVIYNMDSVFIFNGDTLPNRAITYLRDRNTGNQQNLDAYIQKYQPSPGFIAAWRANLQYEVLDAYFGYASNNAYQIEDAYERNYAVWNGITESLYQTAPLKNDAALISSTYKHFLNFYLLRTKEKLWKLFRTNRANFLVEWYGKDTAAGAALYLADQSNDLQQRIIEKTFSEKAREYLYAVLINGALGESEIENLVPIYQKYKTDFPSSQYLSLFEQGIKDVVTKKKRKLTPEMKFIDGALFKSWEDILAYYKGQTVLLDMWGTWCGPCRQDMDKHSTFIKQYFKGRPLTYVYIANSDIGREKLWKELIAYFHLEGDHFIAEKNLTKDIMKKTKGQGFPTYVIIHKDGTFELYQRGYGIDREVLIAQIENALKL